jgi:hypothetical protein
VEYVLTFSTFAKLIVRVGSTTPVRKKLRWKGYEDDVPVTCASTLVV